MKRYFRIWLRLALDNAQVSFISRFGASIFIMGKIVRFFSFLAFLILLGSRTGLLAGYTLWQMIIFFLTFNLVDTLAQLFLREVYRFRSYVVTGDFDYILLKPISPLFRSLFGGTDILDVSILILSLGALVYAAMQVGNISILSILLYILLIINAFFIALAFHITVLSMGVVTTEVDNTIMLYRDITQMGRVPVDFYTQPIRNILTFIIPVGIMMTIPAKILLGLISPWYVLLSVAISIIFVLISLRIWTAAIGQYTSASS